MKVEFWSLFAGVFLLSSCAVKQPQPAPAYVPVMAQLGSDYWVLVAPFKNKVWKTQNAIIIPKGFVTDLTSVPQVFWSWLPKTGKYMNAAIMHDFLYADHRCTKEQADLILKMEMELFGVPLEQTETIYQAVRLFGTHAWEENKKKSEAGFVRVISEIDLDKYLTKGLDSSNSWQAVNKEEEAKSLLMPTRKAYASYPENEQIASVCTDAVSQYIKENTPIYYPRWPMQKHTTP